MSNITNTVIHVKDVEHYEKYRNRGLVIVDFNAVWCGPCRDFAPIFEQMAEDNPGVVFLSVDVEEIDHPDCKDVKSVPTFKVFYNGTLKRQFSGVDEDKLKIYIERYGVQVYIDDELIRKFTPEHMEKINGYMHGRGVKIQFNGLTKRTFDDESVENVNQYMNMFAYDENQEEQRE